MDLKEGWDLVQWIQMIKIFKQRQRPERKMDTTEGTEYWGR